MNCPNCGYYDTRVIDSHMHKDGNVYRKRKCHTCAYLFTTVEMIITVKGFSCDTVILDEVRNMYMRPMELLDAIDSIQKPIEKLL